MPNYRPSATAQISHELRIPLTGIFGMAHCLQQTQLTTQQQKYVDLITVSAHRLLNLEQKLHELLNNKLL